MTKSETESSETELILAPKAKLSPTQIKFLRAYQRVKCNPARACLESNISYFQYYTWKQESPDFVEGLNSIKDFWLECGKSKLMDFVETTEDPTAALSIMQALDPTLDPSYAREKMKEEEKMERLKVALETSPAQAILPKGNNDPLA